jgi:simple sugar transport system ATP-binding protein
MTSVRDHETLSDDLVRTENLTVAFGKVVALNGVNFRVGRGEIVGLLGDNGAGKTTLIKTLIGCNEPSAGAIYWHGRPTRFRSPREARLAGIEIGYQVQALVHSMSITRNFFLGRELAVKLGPVRVLQTKRMREITAQQLKELGFGDSLHPDDPIEKLSGGERQIIAIGRAMYFGAELLLLDEPTAALSEERIRLVLGLVRKARDKGLSVVFVTHKAEEVFHVADRFVILQNGLNYADFRKQDTNLPDLEKLFIYSNLTAMRELTASIAHQIKNPLGVMKLSMQMLRDRFSAASYDDERVELANMIIGEMESLHQTVETLLDFARPLKCQVLLVRVRDVIDWALRSVPVNVFPGARIQVDLPDDTLAYPLDRNLMAHAISNLVVNALEASEAGGPVRIGAQIHERRLQLEVQDWGEGMDEKVQSQAFGFFFSTKEGGTGLGLPIVRRIVDQHRGSLQLESTPGVGTTVRLTI